MNNPSRKKVKFVLARKMVVRKSTDVKQIDYNFRLGDRAGLFASHPSD